MDDINPLADICRGLCSFSNRSGRPPKKDNKITYGPQPQSHISKLLQKGHNGSIKEICKDVISPGCNENSKHKRNEICDSKSQLNISKLLENDFEDNPYNLKHVNATTSVNNNVSFDSRVKNVCCSQGNAQFTCDYPDCTYTSKLASNLYKHRRIHSTEKPYMCDLCSFQTKFVNSLKVHKRTHTGNRPYCCTFCTYRCNSSSNLKKHIKHRHSHINA